MGNALPTCLRGDRGDGRSSSKSSKTKRKTKNADEQIENHGKVQQPSRTDDTDRAILQLKMNRDGLQQHRKKILKMIEKDIVAAKELLQKALKKKALFALKKKAHHEQLVEQTDNALMKIVELIDNVEMTRVQANVVKALEAGNGVMKKMREELSVDKVSDVMSEVDENEQYVQEVNEILAGAGISDADIEAELAQIEEEEAMKAMGNVKAVPVGDIPVRASAGKSQIGEAEHGSVESDDIQILNGSEQLRPMAA